MNHHPHRRTFLKGASLTAAALLLEHFSACASTLGRRHNPVAPMAATSVYSATKAALHSYVLSQRFKLRNSSVRVLELVPPWVRTDLMNSREAEAAMPLDAFIEESMKQFGAGSDEILIGNAAQLRSNPGPHEGAFVTEFNASLPF